MPPLTVSMLARKGGVGRTTTTLNLSGVWAKESVSCLVIDMDSQASLSRCLLGSEVVERTHPAETVAGLFDPRIDPEPEEVIKATAFDNLFIAPAADALEEFNVTSPWQTGERQFVLKRFLDELGNRFGLVIIDTGPNTCGLLAWSSLVASSFVLSPVLCDAFSTQSIISVQRLAEQVQTTVNASLEILGYTINMRQKNAVMDAYEQTLRKLHGPMVFDTVLPLAAAYRQAVSERTPLAMKNSRSKPAKLIETLAGEISDRIVALQGEQKSKEAA